MFSCKCFVVCISVVVYCLLKNTDRNKVIICTDQSKEMLKLNLLFPTSCLQDNVHMTSQPVRDKTLEGRIRNEMFYQPFISDTVLFGSDFTYIRAAIM